MTDSGYPLGDLNGGDDEPMVGSWSNDRLESIMRDTIDAQAQEQRQLEQLLLDVRSALTDLSARGISGDSGVDQQAVADSVAASVSGSITAQVQSSVDAAVERLEAELTGGQRAQAAQLSELAQRLDGVGAASAPTTGPSLQDVHDGLAGVRTDIQVLPEQLGPAVASAVATGVSDTAAQLSAVQQAVADTVAETTTLRAHLAELNGQLSLLPSIVQSLHDISTRLTAIEQAGTVAATVDFPDISGLVDDRLDVHLTAFGTGLGERLDALELELQAHERRLAHHVDEAVLALAQALLRRPRGAAAAPRPVPTPPTSEPVSAPAEPAAHESPFARPADETPEPAPIDGTIEAFQQGFPSAGPPPTTDDPAELTADPSELSPWPSDVPPAEATASGESDGDAGDEGDVDEDGNARRGFFRRNH